MCIYNDMLTIAVLDHPLHTTFFLGPERTAFKKKFHLKKSEKILFGCLRKKIIGKRQGEYDRSMLQKQDKKRTLPTKDIENKIY